MFRKLLAIACMAAGTLALHGADAANVVQYTHDAAGNIVAIQRLNAAPVTFSGFAPTTGPIGTAVVISGTGFAATVSQNVVSFNGVAATITAASASTLTAVVPAGATTGKVAVTVGGHTVSSAQDFIVATGALPIAAPPGVAVADIIATARLSADSPAQRLDLLASGKFGLVAFDASVGAWMSLHIGNFTITPAEATIAYTIYRPDNSQLASGTLSSADLSIHLPAFVTAGTYRLLVRTGLAQVSLEPKLETNSFVPTNGATLAIARRSGQSTRALIAGVTGDQKALMVSGLVTTPVGNPLDVTVALPNGSTFRRASAAGLGTTTPLPPFTATGTHTVVLVPSTGTAQSAFKLALLGGVAVAVGGPAADVAIVNPGEGARLTFSGVAGENLGLGVSGVTLSPASAAGTTVSVYKPDASLLAYASCGADGTGCAANLENLPVTGTYTIIVQPSNGAAGIQRVWLSRDVGGTLAIGLPMKVAISRPGQNARLNFAATAGKLLTLQVRAVATNPAGQGLVVVVRQPDKSLLLYSRLTGAGQTLVLPPLPVTGTYTVFVEPEWAAQGAATATMQLLLAPR